MEQRRRAGAALGVTDLNASGGVLGERIKMISVDDFCADDQAVAAARKLVEARVSAVVGHECSGAAIAASQVYADAGTLMISTFATNPALTEQGFAHVFRLAGRDDIQGQIAADLLAERFGNHRIAIVHDGRAYGQGLAEETRKGLAEHGIAPVLYAGFDAGRADYSELVEGLRREGAEVLYCGGYPSEAGLIVRQAHDRGLNLQFVAGESIGTQDFSLIAGPAGSGSLFTYPPEPPNDPRAREVIERLSPELDLQGALAAYAALEAWARAVETAGNFEIDRVAGALHTSEFETVLGTIGFDEKGDVTGIEPFVWHVWKDGKYAPLDDISSGR